MTHLRQVSRYKRLNERRRDGMDTQLYEFIKGYIFHLIEPDLNQDIYGLP
ncbi:hypothetical protein KLVA_28300 [Klebsiella variicola]|nr:hypothetical protein KLVA_28300 [Klebsiella variicola]